MWCNSDEELIFPEKLTNDSFIDNSVQEKVTSPSFYRFVNQTQDPLEALSDSSDDKSILDFADLQPEMFYQIKWEFVEFDEFDSHKNVANKFKETLCSFETDSKDSFFNIYCTVCSLNFQKTIR